MTIFNRNLTCEWANFVDCPSRLETLGPFLEMHLGKHKKGVIFDAALGIGCESAFLIEKGYTVISNEIDEMFIQIATESSIRQNLALNIINKDWRLLESKSYIETFDAIFILGNSLCLLCDIEGIRKTLQNFYSILKPGGTLIVDERNFHYIVSHKSQILSGDFRYSGKFIYCGKLIKGIPIVITKANVIFGYYKKNNLLGTLEMYPFKRDELKGLLLEVGFTLIKEFSDFRPVKNFNADFFIYVASKL